MNLVVRKLFADETHQVSGAICARYYAEVADDGPNRGLRLGVTFVLLK